MVNAEETESVTVAIFRQNCAAIGAVEQPDAEIVLELAEHPADRGLGDVQFGGRRGKTAVARRGVKDEQRVARGQLPAEVRHNLML